MVASVAMSIPAAATAWWLSTALAPGELGDVLVVVGAAIVGAATYTIVQFRRRAPELEELSGIVWKRSSAAGAR